MTHEIKVGDCLEVLRTMPSASVNCCVTSPPYWGLRDYGTARWDGGDAECDHVKSKIRDTKNATSTLKRDGRRIETTGHSDSEYEAHTLQFRDVCGKCGARRIDSQLGLESTPEAYVAKMVDVFREVRRVLRPDGTCWVNLGDSYASGETGRVDESRNGHAQDIRQKVPLCDTQKMSSLEDRSNRRIKQRTGLGPKQLVGIPWRVAFALQSDGWILRQDIIWAKPNPMPESVRDRCTKAHEYLFLLTKSPKYWYDAEAVKEKSTTKGGGSCFGKVGLMDESNEARAQARRYERPDYQLTGRNRRSVWTVTPKPYKGAHFAVMPSGLIEPCVKAGCPVGGVVLDPFLGSGTVAAVALSLGRSAIGIELNPAYAELARRRIAEVQLPLVQ